MLVTLHHCIAIGPHLVWGTFILKEVMTTQLILFQVDSLARTDLTAALGRVGIWWVFPSPRCVVVFNCPDISYLCNDCIHIDIAHNPFSQLLRRCVWAAVPNVRASDYCLACGELAATYGFCPVCATNLHNLVFCCGH